MWSNSSPPDAYSRIIPMYLSVSMTSYNRTMLGCLSVCTQIRKNKQQRGRETYPKDLDLALDLRHPYRAVNVSTSDELYSNLLAPLTVQTKLDLAKLALAERLEKKIWAKLGDRAPRMGSSVGHGRGVRVYVGI
jgi:hypothetical protein